MPKAYSCELRERVLEAVRDGGVPTRSGRTFPGERDFGGKVGAALARQKERRAKAARRKHSMRLRSAQWRG
jgi:hypothetical protein